MEIYRIYMLDEHDKIFRGQDIDAPDDDAALLMGQMLLETYNANHQAAASGFEVWSGRDIILNNRSESV